MPKTLILYGTNYKTGESGSSIDFISLHTKGKPEIVDGYIRMGMNVQLGRLDWAYRVVAEFPEAKKLPILPRESDPEGTAAYNVANRPENAFRQDTFYAAYIVLCINKVHELTEEKHGMKLLGHLNWAFHFEGSEMFEGFRELSTNGINKAVFNGFKLMGMLNGKILETTSSHSVPVDTVIENGIRTQPEIDAIATLGENELSVLIWHYHDENTPSKDAEVLLTISDFPFKKGKASISEYRVDNKHGNPFKTWQEMGAPKDPTNDKCKCSVNIQKIYISKKRR